MGKLAIRPAVGTAAVGLVALATISPATAQVPVGTTTTVSTDCVGRGTIALKQVRLDAHTTRVVVRGHDVRNGRWVGGYSPEPTDPDREVRLEATAAGREFRTVGEAQDVTAETGVAMLRGPRVCNVDQTVRPRSTILRSTEIVLVARHPRVGQLSTEGLVQGCRNGSRWRYSVSATYGDVGMGYGSTGLVCRDHVVEVPHTSGGFSGEGMSQSTEPDALSLVVRSGDDVRRIGFRRSAPL